MDFTKYEHEIREPRDTVVRPHTDPWHGVEVVINQQTSPNMSWTMGLTVEEAMNLHEQLGVYLAETYGYTYS